MAVPDTTTFNLQTVVNVVNSTSDDLADCFADAVSSKFNATYKAQYYAAAGDKNNLLMFRDYDGGVSNTLIVATDSTGSIPSYAFAKISNESVASQTITYTWKYVSYLPSGNLAPLVKTGGSMGTVRQPGYVSPVQTATLYGEYDPNFYPEDIFFYYNYQGGTYGIFEFTLISATTDTVPSSPDNSTQASYQGPQ